MISRWLDEHSAGLNDSYLTVILGQFIFYIQKNICLQGKQHLLSDYTGITLMDDIASLHQSLVVFYIKN